MIETVANSFFMGVGIYCGMQIIPAALFLIQKVRRGVYK